MFTTGKEWQEKEVDFVRKNHLKMSVREIAKCLGRTHSSVENKKGKLGLKGERKYQFDFDFFKPPINEFSAYWIGFIAADGCVTSDGKSISIELKEDDFEHLKKFNKCLNGNIPVTFRERKPTDIKGKHTEIRKQASIRVFNTDMVKDISLYGITPKKSLDLEFQNFRNDDITWCYIRGYFDGDGSIYYDKNSNQLRAKITSGSINFIKEFRNYLDEFSIKTYVNGMDCGITGKISTKILLSKMYDNANIYLDRKYKKYQNYKYLWLQ